MHVPTLIFTRTCIECRRVFEGLLGRCAECSEALLAKERAEQEAARKRARLAAYLKVCPVTYQETDWLRPELAPCAEMARTWSPGSVEGKLSLGLFGESGVGKTRAAFHILRRHVMTHDVYALHASDAWDHGDHVQGLSSAAVQRLRHAEEPRLAHAAQLCLQRARSCGLLLIDDLGKERAGHDGKVSETVGEALFSLIEYRVAHQLPLIWTCNMSAEDLQSRLGRDRDVPVLRRLQDVSWIVEV
jgi:DNA replication protein DnaC